MPESYSKAIFCAYLASQFVYRFGVEPPVRIASVSFLFGLDCLFVCFGLVCLFVCLLSREDWIVTKFLVLFLFRFFVRFCCVVLWVVFFLPRLYSLPRSLGVWLLRVCAAAAHTCRSQTSRQTTAVVKYRFCWQKKRKKKQLLWSKSFFFIFSFLCLSQP